MFSTATHSLKYFYTAVSGDIDFPEFTIVGLVNNGQFVYYDSNIKRMVPKTEWMKQSAGADYWDTESEKQVGQNQGFKNNIQVLKDRFNQSMSTGMCTQTVNALFHTMIYCDVQYIQS